MARLQLPKTLRVRARHLPTGGVIYTRLLQGVSSYRGEPWFGVRVWDGDAITFPSLAEAEAAFERMTVGQDEVPPAKRR